MKRALLSLECAGNTFQTHSDVFYQAVVKAVSIPSMCFRGVDADPLLRLQKKELGLADKMPVVVSNASRAAADRTNLHAAPSCGHLQSAEFDLFSQVICN